MKNIIGICILALTIAGIVGCNSDPIVPGPDYRDPFEGDYIGIRSSYSWTMGEPPITNEVADTVIVVSVGDSSIMIDQTTIHIAPSGEFWEQGGGSASSYFSVRFFGGDSLKTEMNTGGLGGGHHATFEGRKR